MIPFVDTIVAGAGSAGSAAAWQLARLGSEVLLVDEGAGGAAAPGAEESSGAEYAVGVEDAPGRALSVLWPDPVRHRMAIESADGWRELEAVSGVRLLDGTGSVVHGHAGLPGAESSLPWSWGGTELLGATEAQTRWPALRFGGPAVYAPEGGRLSDAAALAALRAAAVAHGARLRSGTTITRIRILGDDRARIEARTGPAGPDAVVEEIECRRLVVTLGASTVRLLRGLVTMPRFSTSRDETVTLGGAGHPVPAVLHLPDRTAPGHRYWRGAATVLGGPGAVTLGWRTHDLPAEVGVPVFPASAPAPASARQPAAPGVSSAVSSRELAALLRYAREWLPGADPTAPAPRSLLVTTVHDGGAVIDRIGPVVVGTGFGSTGAGLAPAIGHLLAGLAEGIPAPARFALRNDRRRAAPIAAAAAGAAGAAHRGA